MDLRPLTPQERAVFDALSDEFTSTSVIKFKACRSSTGPIAPIWHICRTLERLGLVEHSGSGQRSTCRWRRAKKQPQAEAQKEPYIKTCSISISHLTSMTGKTAMSNPLPSTMISPKTGEQLIRGLRPFVVRYLDQSTTVDLPGYYPVGEGEGVHVGNDMDVVEDALRALKIAAGDD